MGAGRPGVTHSGRARGEQRLFVSVGFFSIVANVLMRTGPFFMLQVYDRVLTSCSEATLVRNTPQNQPPGGPKRRGHLTPEEQPRAGLEEGEGSSRNSAPTGHRE